MCSNREECEEKKEKERKEESCIIASLRPVTDFGSSVQVLDLPQNPLRYTVFRPESNCIQENSRNEMFGSPKL